MMLRAISSSSPAPPHILCAFSTISGRLSVMFLKLGGSGISAASYMYRYSGGMLTGMCGPQKLQLRKNLSPLCRNALSCSIVCVARYPGIDASAGTSCSWK